MTEPGSRAAADERRSPWLRTGFVLAAAFIGFVAVIGTVVALGPGDFGAGESTGAQPPGAGPASRPRNTPDNDGTACSGLDDEQSDIPASAPAEVTWTLYHAVALPSSEAAGPAVVDGDVARCYARTPVGALLATSQISVRYLAAEDWSEVTSAQTVGPGRDAYIADRSAAEETAPPDGDDVIHGQIAGFRFVTYNDTAAVIQTVWRFPDGRMQAATTTVLWRGGDWKLEYPADPVAPSPVDSLAGYTAWGGV